MFPTANPLKISDISKLFNIPISALRYYEKEGLCHFKRSGNNYRFADIRTIRNLCDISFYRKLSCSIEQLHQLNRMDHRQIYQLLAQSRQKLQRQLEELHQMLENIDEKMERIAKIDALSRSAAQVVLARLPAIYRFDLFCSEDISNLIRYERDLFVIVESNGSDFGLRPCPAGADRRPGAAAPAGYAGQALPEGAAENRLRAHRAEQPAAVL